MRRESWNAKNKCQENEAQGLPLLLRSTQLSHGHQAPPLTTGPSAFLALFSPSSSPLSHSTYYISQLFTTCCIPHKMHSTREGVCPGVDNGRGPPYLQYISRDLVQGSVTFLVKYQMLNISGLQAIEFLLQLLKSAVIG